MNLPWTCLITNLSRCNWFGIRHGVNRRLLIRLTISLTRHNPKRNSPKRTQLNLHSDVIKGEWRTAIITVINAANNHYFNHNYLAQPSETSHSPPRTKTTQLTLIYSARIFMQNKMFTGQSAKTAVAHKFISLRRSFQYIIPRGKNKWYTIVKLVIIFNTANKNESKVASIFIQLLKNVYQLTKPVKLCNHISQSTFCLKSESRRNESSGQRNQYQNL